MILRHRAALECPTFPVNPRKSQRCALPRFWFAALYTNSMGTSGNVFEKTVSQESISLSLPNNLKNLAVRIEKVCQEITMRHGEGLRGEPQSSTTPNARFSKNLDTWNSMHRTGGTYSHNCMMETPGYAIPELCISENSQTLMIFSAGESTSRPNSQAHLLFNSACRGSMKWICKRSFDVAVNLKRVFS